VLFSIYGQRFPELTSRFSQFRDRDRAIRQSVVANGVPGEGRERRSFPSFLFFAMPCARTFGVRISGDLRADLAMA